MTNTTNFDAWLEEHQPEGPEEIYCLYKAALDRRDWGRWSVTTEGDKTFIKGSEGTLQLVSEAARHAFITKVDDLKDAEPGMTMEGWYDIHRSVAKDD